MLITVRTFILVVPALLCLIQAVELQAEDDIVAVCRQYMNASADQQPGLETRIRGFRGDIAPVIAELASAVDSDRRDESGVLTDQLFQSPDLAPKYDSNLLHFFIPDGYSPSQPYGLLIFMHGGGGKTPREFPRHVVTHPDEDPASYGLQPHFKNSPFIIVAPSAPWNENTGARWNVPKADEYIDAVMRECRYRFNIDPDRIFLGGYSMGGFGAFHLCQRLSDRLAGGVIFSGAWRTTHWKAWSGLPVFIRHGKADAVAPGQEGIRSRPRYTDVFYARTAHQKLRALSNDNVYVEDDGGHSIRDAAKSISQLARWMQDKRRNAYARHVVAVSPRGWKSSTDTPTPHCHWITIHEIGDGGVAFDTVALDGPSPTWKETRDSFDLQSFRLSTKHVQAGVVDASLGTDNQITIQTDNVKRFSLWLHSSMVDFSRPVRFTLNGQLQTRHVNASLLDVLRSYVRRHDWILTYSAEVIFAIE